MDIFQTKPPQCHKISSIKSQLSTQLLQCHFISTINGYSPSYIQPPQCYIISTVNGYSSIYLHNL